MGDTVGTFSITKVTGIQPQSVTTGSHDQPSANDYVVVVTTGSTDQQRVSTRSHLRLVQD
jgi:hypothetical protein